MQITLDMIKNNEVPNFDCGFIGSPEDMAGSLNTFQPCWNIQYLGDGTQDFFKTIEEAQDWLITWQNIGE